MDHHVEPCPTCWGDDQLHNYSCPDCGGSGTLYADRPKHECHPPGSGWHGTFYYKPDGTGAHIRPGDKWECAECGKCWKAGLDSYGYHQWRGMMSSDRPITDSVFGLWALVMLGAGAIIGAAFGLGYLADLL
jgi:hypothetical protein